MSDYDRTILSLKKDHPFIYYIALKRAEERSKSWHGTQIAHLHWDKLREGRDIWSEVCQGNNDSFYKFHGRNKQGYTGPAKDMTIHHKINAKIND